MYNHICTIFLSNDISKCQQKLPGEFLLGESIKKLKESQDRVCFS